LSHPFRQNNKYSYVKIATVVWSGFLLRTPIVVDLD
jgi:hypothetical protein